MKNKYLFEQLRILQDDYCIFLEAALTKIDTFDYPMIIDEISLFWYSNRDIVKLIMRYIADESECFVFTGASFLDIEDYEHFPFVVLGDIHIVDDPLLKQISFNRTTHNAQFDKRLYEQIVYTIEDNIKIIQEYSDEIFILPVTSLSDIKSDEIREIITQIFLSMFNDDTLSMERYFREFKTIEDVSAALKKNVDKSIIFDENECMTDDFAKRFRDFLDEITPFGKQDEEAKIFMGVVHGHLAQAFNILKTCNKYNMVPYIRYKVVYIYMMKLRSLFSGHDKNDIMLRKAICAYILHHNFNKENIYEIDFTHYLNCIKINKTADKILSVVETSGMEIKNINIQEIAERINRELEVLYMCIEE